MFLRSAAAFAFAAMAMLAAPATAETTQPARCQEMNLRVYFDHGSATLSPEAMQMLEAAERNVSECGYAELRVAVDATSGFAMARGEAIMTAMDGRSWNVARVEPMTMTHMAAYGAGPEFAEVVLSPRPLPMTTPALTAANRAGV
jgi:hypothetical protein